MTFRPDEKAWKDLVHPAPVAATADQGKAARRLMTDDGFNIGILYRGNRTPYQPAVGANQHRSVGAGEGLRAMSKTPGTPKVANLNDLLAVAYQIEIDAVDRYKLLADQMETHNNPELVKVFRDLARAEGIHGEEIRRLAGDFDVAAHAREIAKFERSESPEEAELGSAHYLMTPWHALQLSLAGEKRALAYFTSIVETAKDPKVKEMAAELVEEEAEHVNLVHRLLRRYPKPGENWADDLDPPVSQE